MISSELSHATEDRAVLSSDKRKYVWRIAATAASRAVLVAVVAGVVLAACAGSKEPAVDICKSPWAFAGNNGGKIDRPTVARDMVAAHCA